MVGLMPVVLFLAIFVTVGIRAGSFDGHVRQRLLLATAVLVALLFALGSR